MADFMSTLESMFGGGSSPSSYTNVDPNALAMNEVFPGSMPGMDPMAMAGGAGSGGMGWAQTLPTLLSVLGLVEGGIVGNNQANAYQNAYSTWQQQQSILQAQAQQAYRTWVQNQQQLQNQARPLAQLQNQDLQQLFAQLQGNAGIQRQAAMLSMNPQQISQNAASATQPLNQNLQRGITDAYQESISGSGMTQAPGAYTSGLATALAPAFQQNAALGADFASQYKNAMSLPTASSAPPFLNTLQQMQGFIPSTVQGPGQIQPFTPSSISAPPNMLGLLQQLQQYAAGPYSLPPGVFF